MGYELETISASEWKDIQEQTDVLKKRDIQNVPLKRAIDRANGNFLVQIESSEHRGEWSLRCILVSSTRSLVVEFDNMSGRAGMFSAWWTPLNRIPEPDSEVFPTSATSRELAEALSVLYDVRVDKINVRFAANNFG